MPNATSRSVLIARVTVFAAFAAAACGCGQRAAAVRTGSGPPPVRDIEGVMERKLIHAQVAVEAIARADFERVEESATKIYLLSQESSWFIHDTMTYTVFSEQFRETASAMAADARRRDLEAVTDDYVDMIHACVRCHTYLRKERLTRDFPDKVSSATFLDSLRAP